MSAAYPAETLLSTLDLMEEEKAWMAAASSRGISESETERFQAVVREIAQRPDRHLYTGLLALGLVCPQCGPNSHSDADGCCHYCGADLIRSEVIEQIARVAREVSP